MRAITTEINRVAKEAVIAARDEARFEDRDVTLSDFHAEVAVLVAQSTIENSPMLSGAIERAAQTLSPEFFEFVRPTMGMDENGDYTSDKSKWA
jgi:hypothetical protein